MVAQAIVALLAAAPHEVNPQLFSTNMHGQTPFDVAVEAGASEEVLSELTDACSKLLLTTAASAAKGLDNQVSSLLCLLACLPACLLACLSACLLACLPACLLAYTRRSASDLQPWYVGADCKDSRTAGQHPQPAQMARQAGDGQGD